MNDILPEIRLIVEQRGMSNNISCLYAAAKRLFDLGLSAAGIVLLILLTAIVALIKELKASGPVFVKKEVCGYKGKVFRMLEFNTECLGGKAGSFLKETGLYKLPLLFNVLKGDMSIVGPLPSGKGELAGQKKWHALRMSVKPGIIGLWQLRGKREGSFNEMACLDMKYIRERSFLYDLKIIWMTIILFISGIHSGK